MGKATARGLGNPAIGNTHYVFERSLKARGELVADFEILEADRFGDLDELLNRGGLTRKALLRLHWPPDPVSSGDWESGSVSFHTRSYTRALVIVLWRTSRSSKNFFSPTSESTTDPAVWFDEVRLSQLEPTREQSIALLKAQDLAEGANPNLGIRKFGQFPPVQSRGPEARNLSYRYALYAPPPTELAFPLSIERKGTLRFSYCLSRKSPNGSRARFKVLMRTAEGDELLWSDGLSTKASQWTWHEAEIDLSDYEGQSGSLVLKTVAKNGDPHPMWGSPMVNYPVEDEVPSNVILIAVDTLRADRLSCYGYERSTSPHIDRPRGGRRAF